jgi:glycosyltransferase involved in cell wall biosynthesis
VLPEYRGRAAVRAYMALAARSARHANQLIAISDATRRDIHAHLGVRPERVTTVLLAPGDQYRPIDRTTARSYVAERYGLDAPFIYYVGGLDARKNVATLVRAFGRMRRAGGPQATLAIAGRALGDDPRLFPDLAAVIDAQRLDRAIRRIDVPRADNPLLYAAATVFAYPSHYEGFGLGPLEAMACGAPVVVANASSLPEVVGDAALRVASDDEAGWAAALWRLLADGRLRDDLCARGLVHVRQFSDARVARETLAVYECALGG